MALINKIGETMYGDICSSSGSDQSVEVYDPYSVGFESEVTYISDIDCFGSRKQFGKISHKFRDRDVHLPTLRMDTSKQVYVWKIGYIQSSKLLITRHGVYNGETQEYTREECDLYSALIMMRSKYIDKTRNNYYVPGATNIVLMPQLGETYIPPSDGKQGNIPDNCMKLAVSKKLDGIRAMYHGVNHQLLSRQSKMIYGFEEIKSQCNILSTYLNNESLDGELYRHGIYLEDIASIVNTQSSHDDELKLRYYIFDCMILNLKYKSRFEMLKLAYNRYKLYCRENEIKSLIKLVGYRVCRDRSELVDLRDYYINQGYEGIVIRHLSKNIVKSGVDYRCYFRERNKALLKYKREYDEICVIISIHSGEGRNQNLPIFTLRRIVEGCESIKFKCTMVGNFTTQQTIYSNRNKYIGKSARIVYSNETKYRSFKDPRLVEIM